jgi:hypothetical protein|nr:hypothetical protein [uncultured Acetatifactor sp.]
MAGKKAKEQGAGRVIMTFTVAECGEFHGMGEYHEGIRTLEEAAAIYKEIPPGRRNGIPAIGINLHAEGTEKWMDAQIDVLTGEGIDAGMVRLVPEFSGNPQVQEAVKKLIGMFPEKEVLEL